MLTPFMKDLKTYVDSNYNDDYAVSECMDFQNQLMKWKLSEINDLYEYIIEEIVMAGFDTDEFFPCEDMVKALDRVDVWDYINGKQTLDMMFFSKVDDGTICVLANKFITERKFKSYNVDTYGYTTSSIFKISDDAIYNYDEDDESWQEVKDDYFTPPMDFRTGEHKKTLNSNIYYFA